MPALDHLAGLFYVDLAELGSFEEVLAEAVPQPYRTLLAHHEHMTVSVEQHHGSPVDGCFYRSGCLRLPFRPAERSRPPRPAGSRHSSR